MKILMGKFRKSSGKQSYSGMKTQQKFVPLIYMVPDISFGSVKGEVTKNEVRLATKDEKVKYLQTKPENKMKKIKVVEMNDYTVTIPTTCWHFNPEDLNLSQTAKPRNCYPPSYASGLVRNLVHDGSKMWCTPDAFVNTFTNIKGNNWYPKDIPFEGDPSPHDLATNLERTKRFCISDAQYNQMINDVRQIKTERTKTRMIKIGTNEDIELFIT